MRGFIGCLVAILCWVSACSPPSDVSVQRRAVIVDTVIEHVHVIDARSGDIKHDQMILVRDGLILAISPMGEDESVSTSQRIDGQGAFVTPGLWDSHVHILSSVDVAIERNFPAYIAYGITHVRDLGSNFESVQQVRAYLNDNPDAVAPHVIASGPIMMQAELRWYQGIQRAIGEPGAARAAVGEFQAAGFDLMKAYTGLERPAYLELLTAANAAGMPVDGHVPESMGLVGVVEAGQRTIEHLDLSSFITCGTTHDRDFSGYLGIRFSQGLQAYVELADDFWTHIDWTACRPALQELSARGGALIPTLSMEIRDRSRNRPDVLERLDPLAMEWCETNLSQFDAVDPQVREHYFETLHGVIRRLDADGVRLIAGTDTQNFCLTPAVSLSGELDRFGEAGLSPLTILQTATINPRDVFGFNHVGLDPGDLADFVLWPSNPLDDVAVYRRPVGVYTQGVWRGEAELDAIRDRTGRFGPPE